MLNLKVLLILAAMLVVCGMVTAQTDYLIRPEFRTNLRAAPSLDSRIVTTAEASETLLVVDKSDRWLKISIDASDLWMAAWVSHSRVDGSVKTQSRIDNCCFVDRQCSTDHEWTAGYWAFQNNQCGAAAVSQSQQSTPGGTSAPGDVNNCCFLGWQCSSDQQWQRGFNAYQNNQCDSPVAIEGSEAFVAQVKKALDMLKRWAPKWYTYATSGLNTIREVPESNGSGVWHEERRFDIIPSHAFAGEGVNAVIWLAGIIVHDACHVHRYEAGLQSGGRDGELACLQVQLPATEAIDPRDRFSSWLNTLINNIDDPEYQWWH